MTHDETPAVEPLFSADEIAVRVEAIAAEIAATMPKDLLIVAILKGGFVFVADLIRALHYVGMRLQVDFMTLSSYGEGMRSKGAVTLSRDISEDVTGRHVLIVDDILESGRTLLFARDLLSGRGAVSVKTCLLLDKTEKREVAIEADFTGFEIADQFVIGYGLDLAHRYRGLPYIGVVRGD